MIEIIGLYIMRGEVKPGGKIGTLWMQFDTEETLKAYMSNWGNFEYIGKGANDTDTYRVTDSILLADIVYGIIPHNVITRNDIKAKTTKS